MLKEYLLKGYAVNLRFKRLEQRVAATKNKIDFFVKTALPPVEGIFYDGQIFDAYVFAADQIKSAKKSLILIDKYIDESVLLLFAKRGADVSAAIYTAKISAQLQKDLDKHREQYPHSPIAVRLFNKSHDRFFTYRPRRLSSRRLVKGFRQTLVRIFENALPRRRIVETFGTIKRRILHF